jgi:hypothetical protein
MKYEEIKSLYGMVGLDLLRLENFTAEDIENLTYGNCRKLMRILYKNAPEHILGDI